jgi:putative ABC transport system permease protein
MLTAVSVVRVAGDANAAAMPFPVLAADNAFLTMKQGQLGSTADGYGSKRDVFNAVAGNSKLALIDPSVLPGGFNDYDFTVEDLKVDDDHFKPFDLTYTDTATGKEATVTVIGVLAIQVDPALSAGVYVNEAAYKATFGEPNYLRTYVKLNDGVKAKQAAQQIEAALINRGVQAESIRVLLDEMAQQNNAFMRMFQGFMALGLLTGIAALGVVAFRSVVERRQQIGMLRAIGYQTGTVAMTFVLESGFIAVMGILSGVVGGMIISHNLFTNGQFSGNGIEFAIPWTEITVITVSALFFSLLMTWLPARQAARVPVADALRYE